MKNMLHMMRHVASPQNRAYTLNLIRSFDNENYIANLLQSSASLRHAHAAIRAINVEFDRVRATVANEDLARLRLSFFRSSLTPLVAPVPHQTNPGPNPNPASAASAASAAPVPSLPVLDCLEEAMSCFPHVDFTPILHLLSAREAFLSYPNFASLSALETFAAAPHIPLLHLHAALLCGHAPPLLDAVQPAVASAAKAIGLAILLRAAPVHAASRLSYMPRHSPSSSSSSSSSLMSSAQLLSCNDQSLPVFRHVANAARTHHATALCAMRAAPRHVRPALWPLHLAKLYLTRLAVAEDNPFDHRLVSGLQTTWYLSVQLRLLRARYLWS